MGHPRVLSRRELSIMKPKMPNSDQWWFAQMRSFGERLKIGLIGIGFVSAVGLCSNAVGGVQRQRMRRMHRPVPEREPRRVTTRLCTVAWVPEPM